MLDDASPADIFEAIGTIAGNGWHELQDADAAWRDLRGLQ